MSEKRRDSKGRILKTGEQQRADGRYMYTYKDPVTRKYKFLYAWKLEPHDKAPAGRKDGLSLREKEKLLEAGIREGTAYKAGNVTVLELVERYTGLRRDVRPTTRNGYNTVINVLKNALVGDYYLPDLKSSDRPPHTIGRWGRMRRSYLKEYQSGTYQGLLLTGKLWAYLAELDEQAQEQLDMMVEQMKASEGVTEELKARDQMEWLRRCNSIVSRAEEVIRQEMIYVEKLSQIDV